MLVATASSHKSKYRLRVLGWRAAWMRNESGPACRLKSLSGVV
jgi:hypothetical protein